jgi:hypothetical protein
MPRPVPATELEDPRAPAQGLSSRSVISDGNAHDQNHEKLCLFFIMVQFYTHRHIRTAFPISMIYDSWTGMNEPLSYGSHSDLDSFYVILLACEDSGHLSYRPGHLIETSSSQQQWTSSG